MRALPLAAGLLAACGDPAPTPGGPGTWETKAAPPTPRSESGIAVARGEMITVAGFSDVVERYDLAADRWSSASRFPGNADHVGAAPLPGDQQILVAGWNAAGLGPRAETFAYDPTADAWQPRAPLPRATSAGALVRLDERTLAFVGGSSNGSIAELHLYDVAADAWRSGPPMPTARDHLGAAVVGGKLWAIGGRNADDFTLDTVEVFDPVANRWTAGPALAVGRSGHAVVALDGKIYVFGGEGASNEKGTFPEVEALDPTEGAWRFMAPMPTPRHGIGAVPFEGRIYIPMGGDVQGSGTVAVLEVFVPPG